MLEPETDVLQLHQAVVLATPTSFVHGIQSFMRDRAYEVAVKTFIHF